MKRDNFFKILVAIAGIWVAAIAAYFSIFGISKVFAGYAVFIIIMAAGLEFGKLVGVSYLYRYWKEIGKGARAILLTIVAGLLLITSIGIYGFLSNAYETTSQSLYKSEQTISLIDNKQKTFAYQITQYQDRIESKTERNKTLSELRTSQEGRLDSLYVRNTWNSQNSTKAIENNISQANDEILKNDKEISELNNKINSLQDSILQYDNKKIEASNYEAAADLGPLKYLSRITGFSMDTVINWFILLLIFVFDPLAISMVIAFNHLTMKNSKKNIDIPLDINEKPIDEVKIQEGHEIGNNKIVMDEKPDVEPAPQINPENSSDIIEEINPDLSIPEKLKKWATEKTETNRHIGMRPDGGISG